MNNNLVVGAKAPLVVGPLNISPQISIFGHYLTPQKTWKLTPSHFKPKVFVWNKEIIIFSGRVPLRARPKYLILPHLVWCRRLLWIPANAARSEGGFWKPLKRQPQTNFQVSLVVLSQTFSPLFVSFQLKLSIFPAGNRKDWVIKVDFRRVVPDMDI